MFYVYFIDGQTASKVIDLNSGRVGIRTEMFSFPDQMFVEKGIAVMSPLVEMTAFHGNKIISAYPTELLISRLAGT